MVLVIDETLQEIAEKWIASLRKQNGNYPADQTSYNNFSQS